MLRPKLNGFVHYHGHSETFILLACSTELMEKSICNGCQLSWCRSYSPWSHLFICWTCHFDLCKRSGKYTWNIRGKCLFSHKLYDYKIYCCQSIFLSFFTHTFSGLVEKVSKRVGRSWGRSLQLCQDLGSGVDVSLGIYNPVVHRSTDCFMQAST